MRENGITYDPYTPPYNELKGRNSSRMRASFDNNNNNVRKKRKKRSRRPTQEVAVSRDFIAEMLESRIKNLEDLIGKVKEDKEDDNGVKYSEGISLKDYTDAEGNKQEGLETKLKRLKKELEKHKLKKARKDNNNNEGSSKELDKKRMRKELKNLKL